MKFKIKTYLWSGIVMGVFSILMLLAMPSQVRLPMFDSGAPSPRIIPGICLVGILICSAILLIESLVFKKEKIIEFDWSKEKPCIFLIALLCVYVALTIYTGGHHYFPHHAGVLRRAQTVYLHIYAGHGNRDFLSV